MNKENLPSFKNFTHQMAFDMGTLALAIVKERQYRRIGVRISLEDKLVFQYLMDGKNEDIYLKGKEKVVQTTKHSSDYVFNHKDEFVELLDDKSFCVSGGAIPIFINDECKGSISISGMTQEADHALSLEVLNLIYQKSLEN